MDFVYLSLVLQIKLLLSHELAIIKAHSSKRESHVADAKKINKDMYLFREGDAPDAMYIVKSGTLAVTKTKGNTEVVLAEIKPGSMVGEMALFDNKPRSANVKATSETEVIALPYESLNKQLDGLPVH